MLPMNNKQPSDKQRRILSTHIATILVLSSLYISVDAAHDPRCAYPLVNESMDTTWHYHSCLHSWYEFLWKECMKKFAKRNTQYECADCIGCYRRICL